MSSPRTEAPPMAVARRPTSILLVVLVAALVVACTTAGSSSPSVSPAATGSTSPAPLSAAVTPSPSASVPAPSTPEPTPASSPGATYHVELQAANGRPVAIEVTDESGRLAGAASGVPGDGASVAMGVVEVANDDPSTLRLTWAGPPCANDLVLVINASTTVITVVQPECVGDSIAFDRVLLLTFDGPVSADAVDAVLQAGGDTPAK